MIRTNSARVGGSITCTQIGALSAGGHAIISAKYQNLFWGQDGKRTDDNGLLPIDDDNGLKPLGDDNGLGQIDGDHGLQPLDGFTWPRQSRGARHCRMAGGCDNLHALTGAGPQGSFARNEAKLNTKSPSTGGLFDLWNCLGRRTAWVSRANNFSPPRGLIFQSEIQIIQTARARA